MSKKAHECFLQNNIIRPMAGYKIEAGTPDFSGAAWPSFFSQNSPWYHDHFTGKPHVNLMGNSQTVGPMVVSILCDETLDGYNFFRGSSPSLFPPPLPPRVDRLPSHCSQRAR